MNELKVIDVDKMADVRSLSGQFYRKSEVDEVIEYLQNQLSLARTGLIKLLAKAQHEARYQKYKRCLAMARWCLTESVHFHYRYDDWGDKGYDRPYKWKKVVFWKKWARYWLELSEKFKEAK